MTPGQQLRESRCSEIVSVTELSPPHTCFVCQAPEYQQAELIIQHSGLQPENWDYLLHEIAAALIDAKRPAHS